MTSIARRFTLPASMALLSLAGTESAVWGAKTAPASALLQPVLYADMADLVVDAPVVARIRVRSVVALDPGRYPPSRAGDRRVYVVADTVGLIRGDSGLAGRISFIADAPPQDGPRPAWKKREFLIFGKPASRLDEVQLLSRRAMMPWATDREALARRIVTEQVSPAAPPVVLGIESAFHVRGTIPGESETQMFADTLSGRPVSMSIIRRPGTEPLFGVALGEVVDEAAALPVRDTLLWYRLACALPPQLPLRAVRELEVEDAAAARADYGAFIVALGRCSRSPG
jgi:hypothetical protein